MYRSTEKESLHGGGGFRFEIQGLRAIAVLSVLVFHIWPEALPGGYVGVDVFFVISGYLITKILFRDFSSTGRIHIREFYARRIRRLLPAASVVILAVAFALPLLPASRWEDTIFEMLASTFYAQNWWLARQAVDYLAAESAPSPFMHFWSLSVEEQYYIFWPALLMLLGFLPSAWRRGSQGRLFSALVLGVVVLSFAYSVWLTFHNPSLAYFSTLTRAWELGIGGLLAVTVRWRELPPFWRDLLGGLGLAMIVAAVFLIDRSTPFPGYAAVLPVLGTALVLVARDSTRHFSAFGLLRLPPLQYLGDISYSLYLWHWPVIVFYGAVAGVSPGFIDGMALLLVSCALAHQSKALVEDRFRHEPERRRYSSALGLASLCIVLSVVAAWAAARPWTELGHNIETEVAIEVRPNPGAAALYADVEAGEGSPLPKPALAKRDVPAPYIDKCMARGDDSEVKVCRYGETTSDTTVLLIGDTYAAQWQPALEEVAIANQWSLLVAVKTGCALGDVTPLNADRERFHSCESWQQTLLQKVRQWDPDVVLIAQSPSAKISEASGGKERAELLAGALAGYGNRISSYGMPVVFIGSTPSMGSACRDPERLPGCSRPRNRALPKYDPAAMAARKVAGSSYLDLSKGICGADKCDAVVGNVVVYRGSAHLTATYSSTLAPLMARSMGSLDVLTNVKVPSMETIPLPSGLAARAIEAKRDNPDVYSDGCHVNQVSSEPTHCIYGDKASSTRIVLVGDSHSAQWVPPLQEVAEENGWSLYTFTKSACTFADVVVQSGGREYTSCTEWNRNVMAKLKELKPQLVVMSQSRGHRAFGVDKKEGEAALVAGLVGRWGELQRSGIRVLVIPDTPWMKQDVPDCLSSPRTKAGACDTPVSVAYKHPDPLLVALEQDPEIASIDLNSHICDPSSCPAMKGDAVIWRDRHHLTASYARTFEEYLAPKIKSVLK